MPIGSDNSSLIGVSCPSVTSCLAVGDDGTTHRAFSLTPAGGGAGWNVTPLPADPLLFGIPAGYSAIDCADTMHCIIARDRASGYPYGSPVLSTADGGSSWHPQATADPQADLVGVACVNATSCWAVGNDATKAVILHTVTGGEAWPSITSVSPNQGPTSGGTIVTVTGIHFDLGVASVSFGSETTTDFTLVSPSELTVTAPPAPGGQPTAVDVQVNALLGTSPLTPADQFTYVPTTLSPPFLAAMDQHNCYQGNGTCTADASADAVRGAIAASTSEAADAPVASDGTANGNAWGEVLGSLTLAAPVKSITFHAVIALTAANAGHSGASAATGTSATLNLLYGAADSTCASSGCTLSNVTPILNVSSSGSQSTGSEDVTQDFTLSNEGGGDLSAGTITVTIGLTGHSVLGAGDLGTEAVSATGTVQSITVTTTS